SLPPYLPDLARLEWAYHQAAAAPAPALPQSGPGFVNPTLDLVRCGWRSLPQLLTGTGDETAVTEGEELVVVWQDTSGHVYLESASPTDLAALKLTMEEDSLEVTARQSSVPMTTIEAALRQARRRGLILAPPSALRRDPARFAPGLKVPDKFNASQVFTLQWHLTQACDLHCRHCYDRSARTIPSLAHGLEVLRQVQKFCHKRRVGAQISFTGGNPFLHPHFYDFYRAAIDLGFGCVVLGNPVPEKKLEELAVIGKPLYYQVSLEGLEEHNDLIRGSGNFQRVLSFLKSLRRFEIPAMVMLTLTRANLPQVLPLAEVMGPLADGFNINRLALFGEGAQLELPEPETYQAFLTEYLQAACQNPVMSLKDNLFNILLEQAGLELTGGCTGFGCGAAFNFLTLLSDGEVHACRKMPSLIGNLKEAGLAEIYDSAAARRYRRGCAACRDCPLHPTCGGCLAVTASLGLDPFTRRDPFCFRRPS
ncbi:MAG TPA: thio(seleno)oxazole modification radical SAM maturase SbtM, partial [Thermodesulfobacteriota bacterium]|nr:thio(seleno)oxazole modification radical SAM maturase SbtM [Thermodesulfobacteriota bacterium]